MLTLTGRWVDVSLFDSQVAYRVVKVLGRIHPHDKVAFATLLHRPPQQQRLESCAEWASSLVRS